MSVLAGLWLTSLLLSAVALAIMLGLILARFSSVRRERDRQAERQRHIALMLSAAPSRERLDVVDPATDLLTDITIEFVQLVRGEDRENFLASAARLGVPERLRERLAGGAVRARLYAAEALAHFDDERSLAAVRDALDDPSPDVRLTAALSLAGVGAAPPAKELVSRLAIGTREHSLLTVSLLREIGRQKPEEVKALVLDPEIAPAAKAAAIEALSASGDYSLVPIIAELAQAADPESEELPRYLRALGDFAHPAGAPAVLRGLGLPSPRVRALAAEAAGRIGVREAIGQLGFLLDDPDWTVRLNAGEALLRIGEEGRELLVAVAEGGSEVARRTAGLLLAEWESAR